ncbi:hypothetical protein MMC32_006395 [Xylographa parallela]|nr:hypothetical protein [Xylographa parallela]
MADTKYVFLTGASGFVASHILAGLVDVRPSFPIASSSAYDVVVPSSFRPQSSLTLTVSQRGYLITASVRTPAKAEQILALHPSWARQLAFVYVADVAVEGIFDDVFTKAKQPFDYVIHTASPVTFSVTDFQRDLIDPAVQGTVGILQSAHAHGGPQLKRFVLLGSAVSCLDSFQDISVAGKPYTEKDWNPVTAAQAISARNPVLGYNASKKLAEQAAWALMESHKPVFDLAVICPDIIIGPMLQPITGPKAVNETNSFAVYNFMNGVYTQIEGLTFPFYHFVSILLRLPNHPGTREPLTCFLCAKVDVRNVALAHIRALTTPAASGQRILLVSGLISPQLVINTIRKHFPQLHSRVMEGEPAQILPRGNEPTGWDTSFSTEILGGKDWKYIGLEESVVDTVRSLLALEAGWGV